MSSTKARALMPIGEGMKALPSKLYFRIGEVAGMVGVEPHVLRYWEREFRAIRPTKSSKGQRVYSRKDVENLLRVRALLYEEGFTIAGAKKKLSRSPGESEANESELASSSSQDEALDSGVRTSSARASEVEPRTAPREPKIPSKSPRTALLPEQHASHALGLPTKPLAVTAPVALAFAETSVLPSPSLGEATSSRHAEELRTVRASLLELRSELETLLGELEAE
jgi:DNA-binding transcriptional MerR regulator